MQAMPSMLRQAVSLGQIALRSEDVRYLTLKLAPFQGEEQPPMWPITCPEENDLEMIEMREAYTRAFGYGRSVLRNADQKCNAEPSAERAGTLGVMKLAEGRCDSSSKRGPRSPWRVLHES